MRKIALFSLLCILVIFSSIPMVSAHVPLFMEGGHSLDEAVLIKNPTKSWVIYSEIGEVADPHFFYFEMVSGERIRLMLLVPISDGNLGFRPGLALMGPGLTNQGTPPTYLEIPTGSGVMILESSTLHAEYEGFTPTSFYQLLDLDLIAPATGRYYLAYYEPNMTGHFAIALGYQEIFSLIEWLTVPLTVIVTHLWNRQSPLTLLAPVLLTVIIGLALLLWWRKDLRTRKQIPTWIGLFAGLLFLASGIFILYQMGIALLQVPANPQIGITILFASMPIVLGFLTIRLFISEGWSITTRKRIYLFILSGVAFFFWAGWLIGPIILFMITLFSFTSALRTQTLPDSRT